MAVKVGACSLCRDIVDTALQDAGILNYDKSTTRGKTTFTINIPGGPKTWPKTSLRTACWNQLSLDFYYHSSTRKGDTICCSNY
ncbi:hypothetical protein B0I37DRAFT_388640 [Chaetomium sp. MPI-CAGE-AT-0009]|nr:hypothetical protein B0I37DRAFT_388640 [Chaetomium sp. MPI-CAGE-AT-0009]